MISKSYKCPYRSFNEEVFHYCCALQGGTSTCPYDWNGRWCPRDCKDNPNKNGSLEVE